jgi:hypothetical protein
MNLKVGDRVKIRKDSHFYGGGKSNPSDCFGTLTHYSNWPFSYIVDWDIGTRNGYLKRDLEKVHKYSFRRLYEFIPSK